MNELAERETKMRALLDAHVTAMKAGEAARGRDIAYDMLQVLTGLYTAAYVAAAEQSRRQGRIG